MLSLFHSIFTAVA